MRIRALLVSALIPLMACSAGRVAAWEKGVDLSKKGDDTAFIKAGDAAWANRGDEASLRKALAAWADAAKANPANAETLTKLARGHYLLGDGFLSFEAEDNKEKKAQMLASYEQGVAYAEQALVASSPKFAEKMKAKAKVKDAVDVLEKNAAGPLYWYATNLGKWARAKGLTTAIFHKDTVKKSVERVLALDRAYFYNGPDRYFGAYYSYLSSMMGGDAKKSKEHFDAAIAAHPNYFGTKVLLAELYYGKRVSNRKLFEETLNAVIKGDPRSMPEIVPEQMIEQKKAAALLKKVDDIF